MKKGKIILWLVLAFTLVMGFHGSAIADCNTLYVGLEELFGTWHLRVDTCSTGKGRVTATGEVRMDNSGLHGPSCKLSIIKNGTSGTGNNIAVYKITQNYCALEAGNIYVEHVSGAELNYEKLPGSWAKQGYGVVRFHKK
jgi:hypothetical protein